MTRESNATPELNFQNEIVPDRCSKFTMVHIYLEHLGSMEHVTRDKMADEGSMSS